MSKVSDYSTVGHVIKSHSRPLIFYILKYIEYASSFDMISIDLIHRHVWGAKVGKKHLLFTYMAIIFSLMDVIFYHLVCVAHYFLPYRYDSLSYQYNFFVACLVFFCYIQNSFCHAFNLLCRGYTCNLFCYSNYSLCDIHYFQCCALNFLSVVHNSANTHCNFGVVVPPTWFTAS